MTRYIQVDETLGAGGMLRAGAPFLLQARYPAWFQDFALLEADAVSLYSYENQVMPSLRETARDRQPTGQRR